MKRLNILPVVVAVVLAIAATGCSTTRYADEGYYDDGSYYGVDPYLSFYYGAPFGYYVSPYAGRYYYGGSYRTPRYYKGNGYKSYRGNGNYRYYGNKGNYNNRGSNNWNYQRNQSTSPNNNSTRSQSRSRIFGNRH